MHKIEKTNLQVVTSPRLFIDNNYNEIDENGFLSERIFGPTKNYSCKCGRLKSKKLYEGVRCEFCDVLCDHSDLRYTTFAKVVLPFKIWKSSKKSLRLLKKIMPRKDAYLLDTKQADLALKSEAFLKHFTNTDKIKIVKDYIPIDSESVCIPLVITGGYTLYLALLACKKFLGSKLAETILEICFDSEVLVVPPYSRFATPLEKGNKKQLIKHPINDAYIRLLKISQYDWKVVPDPIKKEEEYLDVIYKTLGNIIPIIDDDLRNYDSMIAKHQYYINIIYEEIATMLSGKEGIVRHDFLGRTVDFTSRAHIVINPALKGYEIKIPRHAFVRLWFVEFLRYLFVQKNIQPSKLTKYVSATENKVTETYSEHIDEFIKYFFREDTVDYRSKLVLINRQPTLFRYGIPCVKVVGISKGEVIEIGPTVLSPLNADLNKSPF